MPSVRELARALRVNPATVSKAYRRLTEAGLLTVRRGEGTFVGELDSDQLEKERLLLLTDGAAVLHSGRNQRRCEPGRGDAGGARELEVGSGGGRRRGNDGVNRSSSSTG